MRIGLNLLHALPEIGGGWNYIANLVSALGNWDELNTYIVFVTATSECLVPDKPNFIRMPVTINSVSRIQRIAYENTRLQWLAQRHRLDCMHWFANTQALINSVPGLVTIYDLQPFLNFASYSFIKRYYLRMMLSLASRRAAILLPMSQATANDLSRILNVNPSRMTVIPPVLHTHFVPAKPEQVVSFRGKYNLPETFWLYVAHMYPHKNHLRLLHAYHNLKLNGFNPWPIVLRGDPACGERQVMETITRLDLERDIIIMPRVDEIELPILFSAASALIFPSLYEGGGIPIIEAMACGCPVAVADISVAREFAGEAVSYFDPLDIEAIEKTIVLFQNDPKLLAVNRKAGVAEAMEFRYEQVVNKLLWAYNKVAQK